MAGKAKAKGKPVKLPGDVAAALAASKGSGAKPDMVAFINNARNAKLLKGISKTFI